MKTHRRQFLKTGLAASALAGAVLPEAALSAAAPGSKGNPEREYYELREYRLKAGADRNLLEGYLEHALVPALNRMGSKPVGVFSELDLKDSAALWVLMPFPTLAAYATAANRLMKDEEYLKNGTEYLGVQKTNPNFERIDSWLLLAFAGMPRIELSDLSRNRKERIFEMRTYESYSEQKALKKIDMFNAGEIDVMREVKCRPVFYGQGLIGCNLPHLTYMLCGESREGHKTDFTAFTKHPTWLQLKDDPQYADTVSKITSKYLAPLPFSQI